MNKYFAWLLRILLMLMSLLFLIISVNINNYIETSTITSYVLFKFGIFALSILCVAVAFLGIRADD